MVFLMRTLLAIGCTAVLAAIDAPSGLLCDLMPDASAPIVTSAPAFTWMVGPAEPASVQGACHILVASSADLLKPGAADLWDSGLMESDRSVAVRYRGKPLAPGTACHWQVRIRDRAGNLSAFSPPARFIVADQPGIWPCRPLTTTRVPAVATAAKGDGQWLMDFGRHAVGWLELTIDAPVAGEVAVHLGEKLAADGRVDRKPGGTIRYAQARLMLKPGRHTYRVDLPPDKRNTGKDAVKIPKELGVILPFRHAEIENCKPKPEAVQVAVHYPFDERAAAFTSGDPTLDAVWELCRYSIKATSFCGLYVDGDRERIAYEADAYINQLCHYGTDREYAIARATYEYLLDHPTWPTEWAQFMVLIAWLDWMHTGDLASVERTWDRLVAKKSLRNRMRADGLIDTKGMRDIVDWPLAERDGYDMKVTVNTVVNAFHCRVQECLGDLAAALGKTTDAALFRADAQRARSAFNTVLVDQATGLYLDGEGSQHSAQHANFFPLAFGLVPKERLPAVTAFLKKKGMACSVYGAQFLLDGLFAAGESGHAIALMTDRGKRGWWHMLEQGSTVTLEAWNMPAKPNLDWNHAWGAAPANVLPHQVLGVRPLEAGGATLLIRPQPGNLPKVTGTVPTIRGPVQVAVDNAPGAFVVTVTVPGNTRAKVDVGSHVEEVGPGRHVVRRR